MRTTLRRLNSVAIDIPKPLAIHDAGKKLPKLRDSVEMSKDKVMALLKQMSTIRRMETLCDKAYKQKKIRGFCHLYIGQEAIAVGMNDAMVLEDQIVTGYRDHGWHVVRGGTPYEVFAEMFSKQAGASKGKGGSMHMYNTAKNFYGGNGIVGAQVPLGAGLAFAHTYNAKGENPKNIAVALYGDGAANQGQVYEAFNMAALWKIPCIFTIENNQFGMGTSKNRASAHPSFYDRANYIPGIKVDGMDVLAVIEATRWAKEYCTTNSAPIIMEFDSYRYMGHSMSDPGTSYRSRDDVQHVRGERDCIAKIKSYIVDHALGTDVDMQKLEKEVKRAVDSQLDEAEKSPPTNMAELKSDVWHGFENVPIKSCTITNL